MYQVGKPSGKMFSYAISPITTMWGSYSSEFINQKPNSTIDIIPVTNLTSSATDREVQLLYGNRMVFAGSAKEFFNRVYESPERVIAVLTEAIISLRRTQEYNGVYTAYLLGQLNDEEFSKEAEKYSFEPDECYSEEIRTKAEILFAAIKESVSAAELSDIFKIDAGVAEQVLSAISDSLKSKGVKLNDN